MTIYLSRSKAGPLGKLLALVGGVVLLLAGLLLSAVIFVVIAVAGISAWGYFWWKTRKLRKAMQEHQSGGVVIEGEAIIVDDPVSIRSVGVDDLRERRLPPE
jgi:membrane protein implicated in regulation of membrane protease activity